MDGATLEAHDNEGARTQPTGREGTLVGAPLEEHAERRRHPNGHSSPQPVVDTTMAEIWMEVG